MLTVLHWELIRILRIHVCFKMNYQFHEVMQVWCLQLDNTPRRELTWFFRIQVAKCWSSVQCISCLIKLPLMIWLVRIFILSSRALTCFEESLLLDWNLQKHGIAHNWAATLFIILHCLPRSIFIITVTKFNFFKSLFVEM